MPDMGKPVHPDRGTQPVTPAGQTVQVERIRRIYTPDGRIVDSEPVKWPQSVSLHNMFSRGVWSPFGGDIPFGARVEYLERTITTIATEWKPITPPLPDEQEQ